MLRRCFLPPIPEFSLAADILSHAADALLSNDLVLCARLLEEADFRELRDFSYLITGPINPEIHRQSRSPQFERIPQEKRPRMPGAALTREILARDGYRCRFCESRVIIKQAHKIFAKVLPEAARLGRTNEEKHFGLSTLTASIDHILPFQRGGSNDTSNLVTACGPCQYGRNQWTLEEVEIDDPRKYPPIIDDWDGLTRLLNY